MATAINKLEPVRSNPDGRTDGQLDTQNTNARTIVKTNKTVMIKNTNSLIQSGPTQMGGRTESSICKRTSAHALAYIIF